MDSNLLLGSEVLDEIYILFKAAGIIVEFDEDIKVVIADNSDVYHEKKDYSKYESLVIYSSGASRWVVALGKSLVQSDSEACKRDLYLRRLDDTSNMTAEKDIERAKGLLARNEMLYFSALFSQKDESIGINDFALKGKLAFIEDLITLDNIIPTESSQGVLPFGSTITTFEQAKYDEGLPKLIFEQLTKILS